MLILGSRIIKVNVLSRLLTPRLSSLSTNHLTTKKIQNIDFENTSLAFKSKSNLQLIRTYFVFQLCSINFLVNNQMKVY